MLRIGRYNLMPIVLHRCKDTHFTGMCGRQLVCNSPTYNSEYFTFINVVRICFPVLLTKFETIEYNRKVKNTHKDRNNK
jgi:hypothetical protein